MARHNCLTAATSLAVSYSVSDDSESESEPALSVSKNATNDTVFKDLPNALKDLKAVTNANPSFKAKLESVQRVATVVYNRYVEVVQEKEEMVLGLNVRISEHEEGKAALKEEVSNLQNEVTNLKDKVKTLDKKLTRSEADNAAMKMSNSALQTTIDKQAANVEALEQKNGSLKRQRTTLRTDIHDLRNEMYSTAISLQGVVDGLRRKRRRF